MPSDTAHPPAGVPTTAIFGAAVLGFTVGHFAPTFGMHLKIAGDIFLNLLFVLVIPLVVSSMISGIAGLGDIRHLGSLGLKTFLFYLGTTFLAVLTGIILVNIIGPGRGIGGARTTFPDAAYTITVGTGSGFMLTMDGPAGEAILSIQTDRQAVELMDQGITGTIATGGTRTPGRIPVTAWTGPDGEAREPSPDGAGIRIVTTIQRPDDGILDSFVPRNVVRSMAEENIFPLIVFCLFFGAVLSTAGSAGKPLIDLVNAVNVTTIRCVMLLMYLAPVGIFGLVAARIGLAETTMPGGFAAELIRLGKYAGTVTLGLVFHGAITLMTILFVLGRRHPFRFFRNMIPQFLTAFSTGSSMATLPVSLSLVTEKNQVSARIADFVLPLGATINMDGTALYEGVAAIFIAQLYGIHLGAIQQLTILLTATVAAIGAAAIPQAGLVTMVVVLRSVGLPLEGIGAILSIDWFLDRLRTMVNTWGDVVGAAVIDQTEKNASEHRSLSD